MQRRFYCPNVTWQLQTWVARLSKVVNSTYPDTYGGRGRFPIMKDYN